MEPVTELCIWKLGSRFKVINVQTTKSNSQITLLELGAGRILQENAEILAEIERDLAETAGHFFAVAGRIDPLREHQALEWLQRINAPLGIRVDGSFSEILSADGNMNIQK